MQARIKGGAEGAAASGPQFEGPAFWGRKNSDENHNTQTRLVT